jgi:ketosteroid isomerase-like protein
MTPLTADRAFFAALLAADVAALDAALADDFLIVDVMTGSVAPRAAFLAAVAGGDVRFAAVDLVEVPLERRYGPDVAVVTGATRMRGTFAGAPFAVHSRYTHVFAERDGAWRLASAQGTPIRG